MGNTIGRKYKLVSSDDHMALMKAHKAQDAILISKSQDAKDEREALSLRIEKWLERPTCATINTYWKNLPPQKVDTFWAYSSRHDVKSYYFMDDEICKAVEESYSIGDVSYTFSNGNVINFEEMKQYTPCGEQHRNICRITNEQYQNLKQLYQKYFADKDSYWCLDCIRYYILFPPECQPCIEKAYETNTMVNIRLTQCYDYVVDPYHGTQKNNLTNKIRNISRVKRGRNTKPIYGSYLVKIPAVDNGEEAENRLVSSVTHVQKDPDLDLDLDPSVIEESCIYYTSI